MGDVGAFREEGDVLFCFGVFLRGGLVWGWREREGGTDEDVVEVDTGFKESLHEGRVRGRGEETFLGLLDLAKDLLAFWFSGRVSGEVGKGEEGRTEEPNPPVARGHLLFELA